MNFRKVKIFTPDPLNLSIKPELWESIGFFSLPSVFIFANSNLVSQKFGKIAVCDRIYFIVNTFGICNKTMHRLGNVLPIKTDIEITTVKWPIYVAV